MRLSLSMNERLYYLRNLHLKKVLNKEDESTGKCRMCGQSVKVKDKVGSGCLVGVLIFFSPAPNNNL